MLTLADELALVSVRQDGKPRVQHFQLECGLAGAILAELALAHKIDLRDKRLVVLDPTPGGHVGLDAILAQIIEEPKVRKPRWWVNKLRSKDLRLAVYAFLVREGLVTDETSKALGIFTVNSYPEANGQPKAAISQLIETALAGKECQERTAVLIALAGATGSLKKAFPDADRKLVKAIVDGNWAGKAVKEVLDSITAATTAAVIATTAATSAG